MDSSIKQPLWLKAIAVGTLVFALAAALGMLVGPAGVWLGLWNFSTAFRIMGVFSPWWDGWRSSPCWTASSCWRWLTN